MVAKTRFATLVADEETGTGNIRWAIDMDEYAALGDVNALFALDILHDWLHQLEVLRVRIDAVYWKEGSKENGNA